MTTKTIIILFFILAFTACGNNRLDNQADQETPKALDDESRSYEIISKRGDDDLVESLYREQVSNNKDLKELQEKIDEIKQSKLDSIRTFGKYDDKNQSYYVSANGKLSAINDTILRDKIKVLVTNHLNKYNLLIAKHTELLKVIEAKNITVSDLHNVLKIIRTLPLIEKYQQKQLPGTKSLEGLIKQQDETIRILDTLTKQ